MNDFLRPALYDAKHNIKMLQSNACEDSVEDFDIVGPICETADVLVERANLFSKVDRGDYLFIDNVGAYGAVMSSTYNSRDLIAEVLVKIVLSNKKKMSSENFIKLEKFLIGLNKNYVLYV